MMKNKQNLILLLLCFVLLGFFANFAQNGYGMTIVAISLLLLGLLLQLGAIETLPKNKIISVPVFLGIPAIIALLFAFTNFLPEVLLVPFLLAWFIFPLVAPAILGARWKKKTGEKINFFPYYESIFFALFCFGFAFKIQHWPLAGVLLMMSIFVFIPYLRHIIRTIKKSNENQLLKLHNILYHFFILAITIGAVFSIQHYAKAKVLLFLPSIIIGIFLLLLILPNFRNQCSLALQKLRWITKVVLVSFLVLTLHFWARKFDLVPKLYSNEYPQTYEELLANSNNITEEGIKNKERAYRYYEEYSKLLEALEEENSENQ